MSPACRPRSQRTIQRSGKSTSNVNNWGIYWQCFRICQKEICRQRKEQARNVGLEGIPISNILWREMT